MEITSSKYSGDHEESMTVKHVSIRKQFCFFFTRLGSTGKIKYVINVG